MKEHKIETQYLDVLFFPKNAEEEKMVEIFREGKIFLRWDKAKKKAEIIPNIFKVKHLEVAIVFKTDIVIEEFVRAFMSLWDKGKINIKYSRELGDVITSPKITELL